MKNALRIPYQEAEFNFEGGYKELKYKALQELGTLVIKIYYLLTSGLGGDFDSEKDIKDLGNNIKLYDLKLGQYLLEGDKKQDLVSIVENVENNQVQIEGEFEFKNKFYFILYKPKINGEVNIEVGNIEDKVKNIL